MSKVFYVDNLGNEALHIAIQDRLVELGLREWPLSFYKEWPYTIIKDGRVITQGAGDLIDAYESEHPRYGIQCVSFYDLYISPEILQPKMYELQINSHTFNCTREHIEMMRDEMTKMLDD